MKESNIRIPVDLTNPGQFFACCGLLELADRLWPGAEGWFEGEEFCLKGSHSLSLAGILKCVREFRVLNTMNPDQIERLESLTKMKKNDLAKSAGLEEEKKSLEALVREAPIVFEGELQLCVDWFHDDSAGGSRYKTWAGRQSVLTIAQQMHQGLTTIAAGTESSLWSNVREGGLPFNFDSDLGGQGSALDIGFSFDPLATSELSRVQGSCKPALELLCFIGLQRFRPRELKSKNRFIYSAWEVPLAPSVAAAVVSQAIAPVAARSYAFRLLYRTKYLKSFLPSQPFQGDRNE